MIPLITAIVPVYNCDKFVLDCLNSINNQTYQNFEVIIINDGSIDKTEKICREFCRNHKKFKLISKINGGVSSARNLGLKNAKGDLISFIDADDCIQPCFFEKMLFDECKYDFSVCRIVLSDFRGQKHFLKELNLCNIVNQPSDLGYFVINNIFEVQKDNIVTDSIFGSSCRMFFSKKIIDKASLIFNENLLLGEDKIFVMQYMQETKQGLLVDDYLYLYRVNEKSATSKLCNGYNPNYLESTFQMYKSQIDFLRTSSSDAKKTLIHYTSMKNAEGFVINELKLSKTGSSRNLRVAIKKDEYKQYFKFSIITINRIYKLGFRKFIFLFLIKCRLFALLKLFFSRKQIS